MDTVTIRLSVELAETLLHIVCVVENGDRASQDVTVLRETIEDAIATHALEDEVSAMYAAQGL